MAGPSPDAQARQRAIIDQLVAQRADVVRHMGPYRAWLSSHGHRDPKHEEVLIYYQRLENALANLNEQISIRETAVGETTQASTPVPVETSPVATEDEDEMTRSRPATEADARYAETRRQKRQAYLAHPTVQAEKSLTEARKRLQQFDAFMERRDRYNEQNQQLRALRREHNPEAEIFGPRAAGFTREQGDKGGEVTRQQAMQRRAERRAALQAEIEQARQTLISARRKHGRAPSVGAETYERQQEVPSETVDERRERLRTAYQRMTPEEKIAFLAQQKEYRRRRREAGTAPKHITQWPLPDEESMEARRAAQRVRYQNMPSDQKAALLARTAERKRLKQQAAARERAARYAAEQNTPTPPTG